MKKILLCTSFVLVLISLSAQFGTFNNYDWSRTNRYHNQWNNTSWNNGRGNNRYWNNNSGADVAIAGINGLTQIITTKIIADATSSVVLEKDRFRQMQTPQNRPVIILPQSKLCYDEWVDLNGNAYRAYHECY